MAQKAAVRPASTLTLPSDTEIQIDRVFNAPRDLVWRAFTDAKLLPRWMGPAQYKMTTSEVDLRKGGTYRWIWKVDGADLLITGRFTEVTPTTRLRTLENMSEFDEKTASRNTMTFTERGGLTTVSLVIKVASKEIRDMMLATGMKDGMDLGYVRLDALLAAGLR